MKSRFSHIIVIGCGKIAGDVLQYTARLRETYGYKLTFIEYEKHVISKFSDLCRQIGVAYELLTDKQDLTERFMRIDEAVLIISAGNYYLFPKEVIRKDRVEIINFHNALLPAYPGRNAQSWAIYMGETVTGATWHYVTDEVDSGAVIAQSKVPITGDVKAYELTKQIMDAAFESFTEFFEQLLENHIAGTPQPKSLGERKIYYSNEIPGGGVCHINDEPETIYRLLRAVDYGKSDIFPPVRIEFSDGTKRQIVRYVKRESAHTDGTNYVLAETNDWLYYPLFDGFELAIRLK